MTVRDEVRSRLKEALQELGLYSAVPEVLYHYTTPGGLYGIISNSSFWATDVRYMNDASELKYPYELITFVLDQERESADDAKTAFLDDFRRFWLDTFWFGAGDDMRTTTYTMCFSERPDDLSNWRAYAGSIGGYAIGFDWTVGLTESMLEDPGRDVRKLTGQLFEELGGKKSNDPDAGKKEIFQHKLELLGEISYQDMMLVKVIYSRNQQENVIRNVLDVLYDIHQSIPESHGLSGAALWELMLRFKHPDFRDEREWRLIVPGGAVDYLNENIRCANMLRYSEKQAEMMAGFRSDDINIFMRAVEENRKYSERVSRPKYPDFRTGDLGLVPYVECRFGYDPFSMVPGYVRLPIKQVWVGPHQEPWLTETAVRQLIRKSGYYDWRPGEHRTHALIEVRVSETPLRMRPR